MTVNSLASATTSVISGRVNLRETNPNDQLTFNVDDGATAIDLNVTGNFVDSFGSGVANGLLLLLEIQSS